jgi:outer membrane protein
MRLSAATQAGVSKSMLLKARAAVILAAMSLATAVTAFGQAKIAVINWQKSIVDTQEIQAAQKALEAKFKPRQDVMEGLQKELQNIQQQGRTPNLSPDKEAQLQADFTRKQKELQRLTEDLQADVDRERQDILSKTGRQMQDVVKKMAEERGYDVVIDMTNTVFSKPALEITADATAAYNKAYPAK